MGVDGGLLKWEVRDLSFDVIIKNGNIIDGAGKADGYYIYSSDDLFCIKYDLGLE